MAGIRGLRGKGYCWCIRLRSLARNPHGGQIRQAYGGYGDVSTQRVTRRNGNLGGSPLRHNPKHGFLDETLLLGELLQNAVDIWPKVLRQVCDRQHTDNPVLLHHRQPADVMLSHQASGFDHIHIRISFRLICLDKRRRQGSR